MLSTGKKLLPQTLRLSNCIFRQQPSSYYSLSHLPSMHLKTNGIHNDHGHQKLKLFIENKPVVIPKVYYSDGLSPNVNKKEYKEAAKCDKEMKPTTYKEKLKQAMAQYGSTVIVFHITISLLSLGTCYMLVASGFDLSDVLEKIGLSEKIHKLASSSGTFTAAYLIHKVFAPVRISITLTCSPFIVRYLRKAGFIKKALPKAEKKQ